jgi:phage terminase large subunit
MVANAMAYYSTRPVAFICHWCDTYDPRLAGTGRMARMPFIVFRRQAELVAFLQAMLAGQESGLVEKCRDMGATWVCVAFSVWLWLFWPGAAIGWGSRKEQLVDKLGDPDSIFEKMRMLIRGLPREFLPAGFVPAEHMTYMRIINPEGGATITGEAGENIGRGGRKLIYFKDEAAHYERAERIEAALADNTRVQIDISSVNGLGNVFHRRREAGVEWGPGAPAARGKTNVFVMDWRDHPGKTQEWFDARRQKAVDDGLLHVFAQEVERNYAASVEGVIIPAEWVSAAIDAHLRFPGMDEGGWCGALDVADGGLDRNALALRKGVVLHGLDEWGAKDTGETARRAVAACANIGRVDLQYDCIGVGAGVKAETNRLASEKLLPSGVRLVPWDAGSGPLRPDSNVEPGDTASPLNKDFYANLKAQGWWQLRRRFERTYRATKEGVRFSADDMISISSKAPFLRQLQKELSQPTMGKSARLKLIINKAPDGTRSPNLADAVMMAFWPAGSVSTPAVSAEFHGFY